MLLTLVYSLDYTVYYYNIYIIPEQFTVKAHPALFEGDGEGSQKWGIVIPVYCNSWHNLSKRAQNTKSAKASTACVYYYYLFHNQYFVIAAYTDSAKSHV